MLKKLLVFSCFLAVATQTSTLLAQDYTLETAFLIEDGGVAIDLAKASMPYFVDWNNDGKKDLLASWYDHAGGYVGRLNIWLNQGTNDAPVFNGFVQVDNITEFDGS